MTKEIRICVAFTTSGDEKTNSRARLPRERASDVTTGRHNSTRPHSPAHREAQVMQEILRIWSQSTGTTVSTDTYARRIDVSLAPKNRLARSDPSKKTKPSAISTVPAQAAVDSQLSALAAAGTSGVAGGTEEAAISLSSVDAANSVSTSTERGAARSGVSGSIAGWAAMGAADTAIAASRARADAVSTTSGADAAGSAAAAAFST
jgi:hypothetical protein